MYDKKTEVEDFLSDAEIKNSEDLPLIFTSEAFQSCVIAYTEYSKLTLSGEHGATAKFWLMYIEYIRLYHQFERSICTNDIDLFIITLTPMINLFFATNHIN